MEIIRNADGTLVVEAKHARAHPADNADGSPSVADDPGEAESSPGTRLLHPGEGGYDEALAEWDLQQNPEREPVVSTSNGTSLPAATSACSSPAASSRNSTSALSR